MSDSLEARVSLEPQPAGFRFSLRALFVAVFCCSLGCAFWIWIIEPAKEAGRRSQCVNNLKQIGVSLLAYADVHQRLPAAYGVDADRQPIHSWRLMIVPFGASTGALFEGYDYDQSWDFPANQAIADRFGHGTYRCPSAPRSQPLTHANYVMPLGPHAVSDGPNSATFGQFSDGLSNTIVAGEIANSDIYWTEPRDLPLDATNFRVNDRSQPNFSSSHRGAAMFVFADGHIEALSDQTDPAVLKALLSIDGDENVSLSNLASLP